MSDNILKIIASSPTYMPAHDIEQSLLAWIKRIFPLWERININTSETIQFIDSGSNLDSIICPNCGKILDKTWWSEAVDKSYQNQFFDLEVIVPCCKF